MTPFESKGQGRLYAYRTMLTDRLKRILERNTKNNEIIKRVLKEREEEET